ncbi:MAG TPA: NAD-dependent epimerase/dehydratase family protein [Gemmatimonadales bacterium]
MAKRVAVIGFGAVGRETARLLAGRGDEVRVVQRRAPAALPRGARAQAADVEDAASIRRACEGVEEVALCLGLPYDSAVWERAWPVAMSNVLEGCSHSGARLVFADNLYMYGPQDRPLTEDMPLTDYGRKPRLRAAVTRLWMRAHGEGRVRAAAVRAADFYGPDVPTSVLAAFGVARLVAGKPAISPYPPDQPHDFTYVPDFARALVSLIDGPDDAFGRAWHVPNAPTHTLRELIAMAAQRIGVRPRLTVLPRLLAEVAGLFNTQLAEIGEMRFQWDRPYRVDSSSFSARFWSDATPFEQGLAATIAFYSAARP